MTNSAPVDETPRKPRGFAIPGYAAAAAKKGQQLGLTRRIRTAAEARAMTAKWRQPPVRDEAGRFTKRP